MFVGMTTVFLFLLVIYWVMGFVSRFAGYAQAAKVVGADSQEGDDLEVLAVISAVVTRYRQHGLK